MKCKFTFACCLFMVLVFTSRNANAQFFNYLPEESNYINGNVKNEGVGLTYSYRLQDKTTLVLKTILIHTTNSGQALWMKEAGSNFASYTMAPDTSVILTGGSTTSGGNRVALLQKIDKTGIRLWAKSLRVSSNDVGIGSVLVGEDNTIFVTITRSSFISSTYYSKSAAVAIDKDGKLLWVKNFGNSANTTEFGFSRTMLASNGDFIGIADIRGSAGASANAMMITRITLQGNIVFSKYIDFLSTHNQLSVTGLVETSSQNIVFGGRLMTDQISTYTNTMWLASMDAAGNLIQQKTYYGGESVGEQLHGLAYHDDKIYAYVHFYSPFDSVPVSNWIGTIDEATLAFDAHNSTELGVTSQSPYGTVSNSFCISDDGKPTVAAGFYCTERERYLPLMQQWSPSLASSCEELDRVQPLIDSVANYPVNNYTSQITFTVNYADDTTIIALINTPLPQIFSLCNGCSTTSTRIKQQSKKQQIFLYPNPGDGHFTIELEQDFQGVQLTVYNLNGQVVYDTNIQSNRQSIDMSAQSNGIYFVRIHNKDGEISSAKLIKNR